MKHAPPCRRRTPARMCNQAFPALGVPAGQKHTTAAPDSKGGFMISPGKVKMRGLGKRRLQPATAQRRCARTWRKRARCHQGAAWLAAARAWRSAPRPKNAELRSSTPSAHPGPKPHGRWQHFPPNPLLWALSAPAGMHVPPMTLRSANPIMTDNVCAHRCRPNLRCMPPAVPAVQPHRRWRLQTAQCLAYRSSPQRPAVTRPTA